MAHTFDPDFLDQLEALTNDSWDGVVWRQVFGSSDPLRPNQRGARWNPPGLEALYCSLTEETATAEIDFLLSRQPVRIRKARVSVELKATLTRVVDLRDSTVLSPFGIERGDLISASYETTRLIGRAVAWLGCAGMLVLSARHDGSNLVVYTNMMATQDVLEVLSKREVSPLNHGVDKTDRHRT